jgi:hypothetical protein
MELADSTAVMQSEQAPTVRAQAISASVTPKPIRKKGLPNSGKRCTCGNCNRCLNDAKWERIFREKFLDPNYYAARLPRSSSPLSI